MSTRPIIAPPTMEVPRCCGSSQTAEQEIDVTTRFHFSLNVSDLDRSVDFYSRLFGVPPAKHHSDYAKFEVDQPPLVFALVPNAPASNGALSHLGFPVASVEEVEAARKRLENANLTVTCQNDTVCGYARQDKIWVADPDNNYWEIYVVHEDVEPDSVRSSFDGVAPASATSPVPHHSEPPQSRLVWEHRVTDATVQQIEHDTDSVDEVRLTGTFNGALSTSERSSLLVEAFRVLKPGGKLAVHGLVSNIPLPSQLPSLPGMASLVKQVLTEQEPPSELADAGFRNIRVTKLSETPVFIQGPAEMREIKISAIKPLASTDPADGRWVVYKGPFSRIVDDGGQVYQRGERTLVSLAQRAMLAASSAAEQFLFIEPQTDATCGCGGDA